MLFSSPLFLFLFLPVFAFVYAATPRRLSNFALLAASAFFYAWGEPAFLLVVILSSVLDYFVGFKLVETEVAARRKLWVALAVAANLGLLLYFKYANFFIENVNSLFTVLGLRPFAWLSIALPIGVSFIVFEKITYVVDLYRGKGTPASSFGRYLLYVLFFPKLMAGPIIKYHDIAAQFQSRSANWEDLRIGILRFVLGLAKKTLLADTCGHFADKAFAVPHGQLDAVTAWVGILCFSVKIYFDFAGYSDMAIGLARCLGFRLLENFNHPYTAQSFTDFWRRWHISLSSWIREYLYIPLGGSRGSASRTYFNLWFCFLISGIWHGASWMFVLWGAYHGIMLVVERLGWAEVQQRSPVWLNRSLTFLLVVLGWIPFRAESPAQVWDYFGALFRINADSALPISGEIWAFLAVGLLLCFWPAFGWLQRWRASWTEFRWCHETGLATALLLFWVAAARMASSSHQAFIYFRF